MAKKRTHDCKNIQINELERREEEKVHIRAIAEYLGWQFREEEGGRSAVSRDKFPYVKIQELDSHKGSIFVWTIAVKRRYSHLVTVLPVEGIIFRTYQRVMLGKVLKEVKEVVVMHQTCCYLVLNDESPDGFHVFLGEERERS